MVKGYFKQALGRVGFLMLRDGTLELKGNNVPILNTKHVQQVIADHEKVFEQPAFQKSDYFASAPFVEGLVSSLEFEKKGMQVNCLNSRMIYPKYGVYMPTSQEYLNLLSNYLT